MWLTRSLLGCVKEIPGNHWHKLCKNAIEDRLAVDPIGFGKTLQYSLKGHRRLLVSDYRVVYKITPQENSVLIIAIKYRKDVYEN